MDDKEKMTVGEWLKVVAILLVFVGLICSAIATHQVADDWRRESEAAPILFLGFTITVVTCLAVYGFGELISNSAKIRDYTYKQYTLEKDILTLLKRQEREAQEEKSKERIDDIEKSRKKELERRMQEEGQAVVIGQQIKIQQPEQEIVQATLEQYQQEEVRDAADEKAEQPKMQEKMQQIPSEKKRQETSTKKELRTIEQYMDTQPVQIQENETQDKLKQENEEKQAKKQTKLDGFMQKLRDALIEENNPDDESRDKWEI